MKNLFTKLFTKPTPQEMAMRELIEAKRAKLEAETGRDWATSVVAYNAARIERLEVYIKEVV